MVSDWYVVGSLEAEMPRSPSSERELQHIKGVVYAFGASYCEFRYD